MSLDVNFIDLGSLGNTWFLYMFYFCLVYVWFILDFRIRPQVRAKSWKHKIDWFFFFFFKYGKTVEGKAQQCEFWVLEKAYLLNGTGSSNGDRPARRVWALKNLLLTQPVSISKLERPTL